MRILHRGGFCFECEQSRQPILEIGEGDDASFICFECAVDAASMLNDAIEERTSREIFGEADDQVDAD